MERWSRDHDKCVNCGTTRRRHSGRGYCSRCYRVVRRIAQTERWDFSDPATLKGYPRDGIFWTAKQCERLKRGFLEQLQGRLDRIQLWEETYEGTILGIDLEYQLGRIARLAGARDPDMHSGLASYLGDAFPLKQRSAMFRLLYEIEESVPWHGIDYSKIKYG